MTDFQFKALMSMVLDIVNKSKDLEEVKRSIKNWLPENWLKTITTTKIQMTGKMQKVWDKVPPFYFFWKGSDRNGFHAR